MKFLDLTLPTAEQNLALDEALLDAAEAGELDDEVLRVWEPAAPLVVLGRSSQAAREANLNECRSRGVPVLRRTSGGATIVTGPGCLMYGLVLSYDRRPELRSIDVAHREVLRAMVAALRPLAPDATCRGTSDLAVGTHKFSGNSVRCRRNYLLYHGTLLYRFPIELLSACLPAPPRQPEYRAGRPHELFVRNLDSVDGAALRAALVTGWQAEAPLEDWPRDRVAQLVREKYSSPEWNLAR